MQLAAGRLVRRLAEKTDLAEAGAVVTVVVVFRRWCLDG